jgi:DNA-binding transcriptional LysR family regulator
VQDLNAMILFAKVVQAQSYSQAARDTGIPKSTISRKISQLEKDLNVRLLQRNSRSLSLTQIGKQIFENCLKILQEVETVQATIEGARQDVSGTLRVGIPVSFNQEIIANLSTGFLKQYPEVNLEMQFTNGDVDLIGQGYDITVMFGPLPNSELIARLLFERELNLVASPMYLAKHDVPETPKDLANHKGILLGNLHSTPIWPLGRGTDKTLVRFNSKAVVNSSVAVMQMVSAGLGIGLLTKAQCERELENGELIQVLENYPIEPLKAYGLYSSRFQLAPKISVFLDYFDQQIESHENLQLMRLSSVQASEASGTG